MNRLTRAESLSDYYAVVLDLKEAGVRVEFVQQQYADTPTGELHAAFDAWASGQDQKSRREAISNGRRGRVNKHKRPLPGNKAPYGYRWVAAAEDQPRKTQLEYDLTSYDAVKDIWHYFLTDEKPTLRTFYRTLNDKGVAPPQLHSRILGASDKWSHSSLSAVLHNGVYWGEPMAFTRSKKEKPIRLLAYGPTYVTPEEAHRVHARLATNKQYSTRNTKRSWPTLLNRGIVRCAYCGNAMVVHEIKSHKRDGQIVGVLYYSCTTAAKWGRKACPGPSIRADVLDWGVLDCLNANVLRGDLLTNIFDSWDRDEESAMGEVRRLERRYEETHAMVENQAARLATYAVGDPLVAPIEHNMRMYAEQLPDIAEKVAKAKAAVEKVRHNTALRDELIEWFQAFVAGWHALGRERQRQFLVALKATVLVWRPEDHTPQAQLVVKLPTNSLELPEIPGDADSPGARFDENGDWRADIDIARGAELADYEQHPLVIEGARAATGSDPATLEELKEAIVNEQGWQQRQREEAEDLIREEAMRSEWYDDGERGQTRGLDGARLRTTHS